MPKRGGFFGALWNGIKKFASPIINQVGSVVSGLFGGAKEKAKEVAAQAVNTVANSAQQAIKTGDVRGEAGKAFNTVRRDAMSAASQQYNHSRDTMRGEVSRQVASAQRQFNQRTQQHYGQWRRQYHPAGGAGYGPQYRRPPANYQGYYGAGFGKKHFKKLEREGHKHIAKIHAESLKHLRGSLQGLRKTGKKGAAAARRAHAKHITRIHKEARAGWLKVVRETKANLHTAIKKKGSGMKVGAGKFVGAGTKVGAGVARREDMHLVHKYKGAGIGGPRRKEMFAFLKKMDKKAKPKGGRFAMPKHWTDGMSKTAIRIEGNRRRKRKKAAEAY